LSCATEWAGGGGGGGSSSSSSSSSSIKSDLLKGFVVVNNFEFCEQVLA
jgi:hypothetical protein